MKVIPINNGYYQYKSIDNQMFKSRLSINKYGSVQGSVDILEYDKVEYIIGAGKVNMDFDKTNNEFTKIFVLNMLARFTQEKEIFNVVLSSPPLVYGQQKKELPEYLLGEYDVVQNNKKKKIVIDEVKVFPETIAAYIVNQGQFKGKNIIVVDIGGLTTNAVLIRNNSFTKDDVLTLRHGMYHLDFDIYQYLMSHDVESGFNCSPEDIQYFRDTKDKIVEDEGVIDIYSNFIDEIMEAMDNKNWNYGKYEMLVTGGGGKVLYEYIQRFFKPEAVLSDDPIMDNLKGLEILAKKVFI